MSEFRKVLERDAKDPPANHLLGLALARLGRPEEALRSIELSVKYGEGYTEAWKSLGFTHFKQKNYESALAAYRKAATIEPGDAAIHQSLSLILFEMGEPEGALQHLYQVCVLSPEDAQKRMFLATHLATNPDPRLRNGEKAVLLAKEACVLLNWRDPIALDVLGAAYAEVEMWKEAVDSAARALDLARRQRSPAAADIETRLRGYQQRRPWRQEPPR